VDNRRTEGTDYGRRKPAPQANVAKRGPAPAPGGEVSATETARCYDELFQLSDQAASTLVRIKNAPT